MVKKRKNSWQGIWLELSTRVVNAKNSPSFITYLFVGVIAIGGIGVWLPFIVNYFVKNDSKTVFFESQNIFTFAVAILGTLSLEAFITTRKKMNLALLGVILGFIAFLMAILGYLLVPEGCSILVNSSAVITLLIFSFAIVNDDKFDGEADTPKDTDVDTTGYHKADVDMIEDKE